jgi:ATP-binding cassette subfamily B multidrug efflux pump
VRKLAHYFIPYLLPLVLLLGLVYGQTWTTLALPNYMATIIDNGIVARSTRVIYHTGLIMIIVALLGGIFMVCVSYVATRMATSYTRRIREAIFTKIERFSLVEFNNFSSASLITRSTNDVQQIQQVLVMLLRIAFMGPFMAVGAIIKAYHLAPSMTWIMAIAIAILILVILSLFTVVLPKFQKVQKLVDRLNLVTREFLTGIRVIRAFNREKREEEKFNDVNKDLRKVNIFVNRLLASMQPSMMLIMNGVSVLIVWVGAHEVSADKLQIGGMLAFVQYAAYGIMAFLLISIIFVFAPRAMVSAERIGKVLDTEPVVADPLESKKPVPSELGVVAFKDVTFAYTGADRPVLEHITFEARPGQTTAFVGSTGSGKSTLINLIPRFYDVSEGQVLIDGVDVRDMTQVDLHRKIGYVPQKAVLFSGTIESNITYGSPHATPAEVEHSAVVAQATEFINQLDEHMGSPISQGGINVSGGQKQRLSIARALAYKPEIYIFDDSFSALDFATDAKLRNALAKETVNKTVLIVAQRISTIMQADNIIVIDDGRIVGQGRHAELLKNCKIYQEIAQSQLSDEELKVSVGTFKTINAEAGI